MIYRQLFTSLFFFLLIPLSSKALLPPSPAGGGMLRLDETHDFVATVEALFPDEEFGELTAEAWIYFEEPPQFGTFWTIIGQEGRFGLVLHGNSGALGAWGYAEGARSKIIGGGTPVPKGEWVHVVATYDASAGKGMNGRGGNLVGPGGHLIKSDKPLRIGGIVPQDPEQNRFVGDNVEFQGYIDEIRVSNVMRYGPVWEVPKGKFKVDKRTLALWHFDEAPGANQFKDTSGNGYDLWRNGTLAVKAQGKLATTWGKLKQ